MDFLIDPYRFGAAAPAFPPVAFFANHDSSIEGTSIPATSAQILASRPYAKRVEFLAHLATLGMSVSEADFEAQSATSNATTPLSINAVGAFSMTFTAQGLRFNSAGDTTPSANKNSRINAGAVAGRYNLSPTTGSKFMQANGNGCRWVFPTPISAFGLYVVDLGDNTDSAQSWNNPFNFTVQTSAGELSYTPDPALYQPPVKSFLTQDDFWFWGFALPSGVTLTEVLLRWQDYTPTPSLEDVLGADGFILGRY